MKDEYLWQKTGEDPEIERLEKALAVFRYRDASPPATTPVTAVGTARWLSLGLAFASLALVSILAAAWLMMSRDQDVVFVTAPDTQTTSSPVVSEPPELPTTEPPTRRHSGPDRISPTIASINRRPKTKVQKPRPGVAVLTAEERYAYRQLMLALSITGSKLKIVQDTIDGTESIEDTNSNNDR